VGAGYVAVAFALWLAFDIVGQQFGWQETMRRGITIALAIGPRQGRLFSTSVAICTNSTLGRTP